MPNGNSLKSVSDITKVMNTTELEKYITDVKISWGIILASAFIALVVGCLYMYFLRFCAGVFVWLGILIYFVAVALLTIFFYNKAMATQEDADKENPGETKTGLDEDARNLKIVMAIFAAIFVVSLIGLFCLFRTIKLAVAIIKSAAVFVNDVRSIMIVPPVISLCLFLFWSYWIVVFIFLYSVGEISGRSDSPFASVKWSEDTRKMIWYHLFAGL